jgi:DNA-binding Xre family transcriptional regulator
MGQSSAVISTLKQALKSRRVTYAEIARRLGMSEANIKRMFSSGRFTLERLEAICRLIDLELSDLFALHEASRRRISHLSEEQERELMEDTLLFLVAVCVRNHLDFETILSHYHIDEPTLIRKLAKLDRLKIIDLLPGNRIKLRVAENFHWIPHGPIERYFEKAILNEFLQSGFNETESPRLFLSGLLSTRSVTIVNQRLRTLSEEFIRLHRQDSELPISQRKSIGLFIAMREWEFSLFKPYIKPNSEGVA